MKGIHRSTAAKAIAFVLILSCAAVFTAVVVDLADIYSRNSGIFYEFENSFETSYALENTGQRLMSAFYADTPEAAAQELTAQGDAKFYIKTADGVYTNSSIGEIKNLKYYFTAENEAAAGTLYPNEYENTALEKVKVATQIVENDGYTHFYESKWTPPYTAYVGLDNQTYYDMLNTWHLSRQHVLGDVYVLCGTGLLALALLVYLLCVCGRKREDGELHMLLIDRLYVEIMLAITLAAPLGLGVAAAYMIADAANSGGLEVLAPVSAVLAVMAAATLTVGLQSLVRNLKNKSFIERMLSVKLIKTAYKAVRRALSAVKRGLLFLCGSRISAVVLVLFAAYSLFIALFAITEGVIPLILLFAVGVRALYLFLTQLDKIKTGIFQIRNGNADYKIEGCKTELLANVADALNSVNEGVRLSVEREVKAQRMKSELITNVSHDLKTPLTSIISYSDLLSGMELAPKEANDYAKIIKQKADRLKRLTGDLFDISKAESGNETVALERLDVALLLRQSLAELNNEIEKSSLGFVCTIPEKEIFVTADGKKLSRVFENLLVNALKYSMEKSRVYIDLSEKQGEAVVSIKNISAAPMNFDPSEITERFVRGDSSRTTEGSGLGLAIAKSYAELCGGELEISVDGDLFKAVVKIKK